MPAASARPPLRPAISDSDRNRIPPRHPCAAPPQPAARSVSHGRNRSNSKTGGFPRLGDEPARSPMMRSANISPRRRSRRRVSSRKRRHESKQISRSRSASGQEIVKSAREIVTATQALQALDHRRCSIRSCYLRVQLSSLFWRLRCAATTRNLPLWPSPPPPSLPR